MKISIANIVLVLCLMLLPGLCGNAIGQRSTGRSQGRVPAIRMRQVPDTAADRLRRDKEFSYANDPKFWQRKETRNGPGFMAALERFFSSAWLKWVVYGLVAAAALFIAYQVVVINNFFIFSRPAAKKKISGETHDEHIPAEQLDHLIADAAGNGRYREAVRYLYLKTIHVLQAAGRISVQARATNHDYLQQMQPHAGSREFGMLTGVYEYVWYGELEPSAIQFQAIARHFNQFIAGQ